jgi:hypothetical protein
MSIGKLTDLMQLFKVMEVNCEKCLGEVDGAEWKSMNHTSNESPTFSD